MSYDSHGAGAAGRRSPMRSVKGYLPNGEFVNYSVYVLSQECQSSFFPLPGKYLAAREESVQAAWNNHLQEADPRTCGPLCVQPKPVSAILSSSAGTNGPIDLGLGQIPYFLNDCLKPLHRNHRLRVFLCGSQTQDPAFDLRRQVQKLLGQRLGCQSFLGEDIESIKGGVKADRDHLTIEVHEARRSDLIIIFLGSPGTISELTAFAIDPDLNKKLVVFNQLKYKNAKSFLNLGPLRLVANENKIYYGDDNRGQFPSIARLVDRVVAQARFRDGRLKSRLVSGIGAEEFSAYVAVFAAFPVRYRELSELFMWDEAALNVALANLFSLNLLRKDGDLYLPNGPITTCLTDSELVRSVGHVRSRLMARRLQDPAKVNDYIVYCESCGGQGVPGPCV